MKITFAFLGVTLLYYFQNCQAASSSAAILQGGLFYDDYAVGGIRIPEMEWLNVAKLLRMLGVSDEMLEPILITVMDGDGWTKPEYGAVLAVLRHLMKTKVKESDTASSSSSSSQPPLPTSEVNKINEILINTLKLNVVADDMKDGLTKLIQKFNWNGDGFYDVVEFHALLELLLVGNGILAWSSHVEDIRNEIHRVATIYGSMTDAVILQIIINLDIDQGRLEQVELIEKKHIVSSKGFVWKYDAERKDERKRHEIGTLSLLELESALQGQIPNDELAAIKMLFAEKANPGGFQTGKAAGELDWSELLVWLISDRENKKQFPAFTKRVFDTDVTLAKLLA